MNGAYHEQVSFLMRKKRSKSIWETDNGKRTFQAFVIIVWKLYTNYQNIYVRLRYNFMETKNRKSFFENIGYNFYREACALGRATTWTDFADIMDSAQVLLK